MDAAHLNDKQRDALQQFSKAVKDCQLIDSSESYLLTWLVARNFDVSDAEKMLRNSLEWRRINKVDKILDWQPPEVLVRYFPIGLSGHDRYGGPVWINAYGRADSRGILQSVAKEDYIRYVIYTSEQNLRHMRQLKKEFDGAGSPPRETIIVDLENLSLQQLTCKPVREVGIEVTKLSAANYPQNIRRIFIINASKLFTMSFSMIKPFISQGATLDKFRIFGTNKEEWKAALLEDIDPDQLPVHYGGTMIDPDGNPMCPSKICMGGPVPARYYLNNNQNLKSKLNNEDADLLVIPSRSKKTFEFDVNTPNSILSWEFYSEGGDIGFQVLHLDGHEQVNAVPYQRVNCDVNNIQEGQIICQNLQKYVVEFDNSFSLLRSKKMWISVSVQPQSLES